MDGGNGGSGIVIIKYTVPISSPLIFRGTTKWKAPVGVSSVDYLVVAGGGGGGHNGAGGGAGGFRTGTSLSVTAGDEYTITLGGGGAGGTSSTVNGDQENNSVLSTVTSTGGGGGAGNNGPTNTAATTGGSRGGGGQNVTAGAAAVSITPITGETTSVQGHIGGNFVDNYCTAGS